MFGQLQNYFSISNEPVVLPQSPRTREEDAMSQAVSAASPAASAADGIIQTPDFEMSESIYELESFDSSQ